MEIINEDQKTEMDQNLKNWEASHKRGKIVGGLILVIIGSVFLAKEMGLLIPHWLLSWKMMLIVIGIFVGFKHKFERAGWIIPVLIGSAFLIQDFFPDLRISHLFWPIIIIVVGFIMMFRPKRAQRRWQKNHDWHKHHDWQEYKNYQAGSTSNEDHIEANAIFGSVKKNIVSKNFTGGEVNAVFGGCEINLMQAEIHGRVILEMNQVFGGTKLIVPAHWEIKSELTAVLGSVEDKRPQVARYGNDEGAILILRGSAVFGGIDIKSY